MSEQVNIRELALDALIDVDKNQKFLNQVQHNILMRYQYLDKKDRAFFTRLTTGTVDYMIYLDYMIDQVSKTKVRKCKPLIRSLLRMSAYQILFMDGVRDSAVCDEAVKLAKKRGFKSLSGFVNGVLRNFIRQKDSIKLPSRKEDFTKYASIKYSIDPMILSVFLEQFSEDEVLKILATYNEEAETSIRINLKNGSKEEVVESLLKQGVTVKDGIYIDTCLKISDYDYMRRLKAFREGKFTVQDESSMLVAIAADPKPGMKVLDCCSAPGGKSLHIADLMNDEGEIISRDLTEDKTDLIEENIERCGYQCIKTEVFDGTIPDDLLKESMDIVICDVPCSGLGILRRKKDIKYHITKEGLLSLPKLQREILKNAISYVKPGGCLVFSTCTLNIKENEENRQWILDNSDLLAADLTDIMPEKLKSQNLKEGIIKMIPGKDGTDGFFISKFKKPM